MSATFRYFGHKISILATRNRAWSQDYIDVGGRSEESICQFLRNISGDVHNLSALRNYVVRHVTDNIHINRMRDHTVLEHISLLLKAGNVKLVVESFVPNKQTILGFSVIRVSKNLQERQQQEVKLKESRSVGTNTAPAKPEPLPPQSAEPAVTPSQLVNPTPEPVATAAPAPEPNILEIEESLVYPSPAMLLAAAQNGVPFCEECARAAQSAS
jgi:hypothetical protein